MAEYYEFFSRSREDSGMEAIADLPAWAKERPPDYPTTVLRRGSEEADLLHVAGAMVPRVQFGRRVVCRVADGKVDVWEDVRV
jgi:hypothetical protein